MNQLKELILKILEAIEYQGDRDAYAQRFIELITKKVLTELLGGKDVGEVKTLMELESALSQNFTKEEIDQKTKTVTQQVFADFFEEIDASLSEAQREKLVQALKALE